MERSGPSTTPTGALDAATRGYLLMEGRIAASGSSAELRSTDAVRQRVLGM